MVVAEVFLLIAHRDSIMGKLKQKSTALFEIVQTKDYFN